MKNNFSVQLEYMDDSDVFYGFDLSGTDLLEAKFGFSTEQILHILTKQCDFSGVLSLLKTTATASVVVINMVGFSSAAIAKKPATLQDIFNQESAEVIKTAGKAVGKTVGKSLKNPSVVDRFLSSTSFFEGLLTLFQISQIHDLRSSTLELKEEIMALQLLQKATNQRMNLYARLVILSPIITKVASWGGQKIAGFIFTKKEKKKLEPVDEVTSQVLLSFFLLNFYNSGQLEALVKTLEKGFRSKKPWYQQGICFVQNHPYMTIGTIGTVLVVCNRKSLSNFLNRSQTFNRFVKMIKSPFAKRLEAESKEVLTTLIAEQKEQLGICTKEENEIFQKALKNVAYAYDLIKGSAAVTEDGKRDLQILPPLSEQMKEDLISVIEAYVQSELAKENGNLQCKKR